MIQCFSCTAEPNPALVSRAELDLTAFTEHNCEGWYRVYSGTQYTVVTFVLEWGNFTMKVTCKCILMRFDWKEE